MKKISFLILTLASLLMSAFSANAQWERVFGISGGNISCLADSGSNIFASTFQSGVLLSTDNGSSWEEINNGLGTDSFILSFAVKGADVFAGTSEDGVFLSTNNGGSWTPANNGIEGYGIVSLLINDSDIFAGTLINGVYISSDNGAHWTQANNGLTDTIISSLAISGSNIFAGTYGGGVFLSSDNGRNWVAVNHGLTDSIVYSLAASGSNIFAGTLKGGVFLSVNNGGNWTAVDSSLPKTTIISLAAIGSNIFAGTNDGGVFLLAGNGSAWTAVNNGLTGFQACAINSLSVNEEYIFAGTQSTENGIWRRSLSDVLGVENINNENGFSIYPNPAADQFKLHFSSPPASESTTVSIMNVVGQEALGTIRLQNREENVSIDIKCLPAGIYFVQVANEKEMWTGRFVKE